MPQRPTASAVCRLATAAAVVLAAAAVLLAAAVAGPGRAAAAPPVPGPVLVVGDSLAVGLRPFLGTLLGVEPTWDAVSGRTTPQGMTALRARLRDVDPQTVVVSLGTNDGPDPARFADRLRRTLAAIPAHSCVVWPAIARPPRKGPFVALNRVLRAAARRDARLHVVDWDRAVARHAVRLPDALHPDPAGYAYRSRMIARAVRAGCAARSDAADPGQGQAGGQPAP